MLEKDRSAPGHRSVGDQRHRGVDGTANGLGRKAAAWGSFGIGAGSWSSNIASARGKETAWVTIFNALSRVMLPIPHTAIRIPTAQLKIDGLREFAVTAGMGRVTRCHKTMALANQCYG